MSNSVSRRKFMKKAGAAAVAGLTSNSIFAGNDKILLVGVSCSPRRGKTTATAVKAALDAAVKVASTVAVSTTQQFIAARMNTGWVVANRQ